MVEQKMTKWHEEADIETESGTLRISAYARDEAGNAPFMSILTDIDSGHASMTIEQAEAFVKRLSEMLRGMRGQSKAQIGRQQP
jgi:hypothetical protein